MTFSSSFVDRLKAAVVNEAVFNPYAGRTAAATICRANLQQYLCQMDAQGPRVLLVGEAPGYRGCRLTGIPFVSEHVLANHPRFGWANGYQVGGTQREATATTVWRALDEIELLPLLWNAFPFHPCQTERPDSNRTPTAAEVRQGEPFLRDLLVHYPIQLTVAVGRKAERALGEWGIAAVAVRHPAHGGGERFNRELCDAVACLDSRFSGTAA